MGENQGPRDRGQIFGKRRKKVSCVTVLFLTAVSPLFSFSPPSGFVFSVISLKDSEIKENHIIIVFLSFFFLQLPEEGRST